MARHDTENIGTSGAASYMDSISINAEPAAGSPAALRLLPLDRQSGGSTI